MERLRFNIDPEVAARFPDIRAGGFLVKGLASAAKELDVDSFIASALSVLNARIPDVQKMSEEPEIAAWRAAYKQMGLKPSEYKCSAEQLARRLLKGQSISTPLPAVNLYCALSAKHLAPMGAYDFERLAERHITLRFAIPESDSFEPLGGRVEDMPLSPKIAVYGCGSKVICWGFNHRDSRETSLREETDIAAFFNEAVAPVQYAALESAFEELRMALRKGGAVVGDIVIANAADREIELTVENDPNSE